MDDQLLFEQFRAAYEFEPRAGSFERLRATLVNTEVQPRRGVKFGFRLPRRSQRLIAAVAIVALAMASAGAFIAINHYAHRAVPVTRPHARTGTILGTTVGSAPLWPFSADDAAAVIGRGFYQDAVFITHDGGATWRQITMPCCYPDSPDIDVRWMDSDNIVVVYGSHLIDVTSDGGIHWQVIRSTWEEAPNLPFFLNAHEGWQYGRNGLFHTTDGGAHWTAVSSFPSFKGFDWWADRLFFVDSEHGLIWPSGHSQPWVTQDGGHTWSRADVSPPPPVIQLGREPQGPFMFGRSGLIAFLNADGITLSVYRTSDGGLTWSGPRSAPGTTIAAVDVKAWWSLDGEGHLSRTSDGGNSWQQIHAKVDLGMTLTSVTPVDGDVLWGIADAEIPVRSTDAGRHWSVVKLPAR
jgi:photosystem II stability/assembly factor-like uncharacterized protein